MFLAFALIISLVSPVSEPISKAIENYKNTYSYQVTLKSYTNGSSEIIKYFYKKPGFVKMEFITPHKGAVLVYNPLNKKVKLRPFGFLKPFVLTMRPDSGLIKSSKGHRVDESDIGVLLKMVKKLQENGKTEILDKEVQGAGGKIKVSVKGNGHFTVDSIHHYLLWLDIQTFLPLKVSAYDLNDELIEEVLMEDLKINVNFPEDFFEL